MEKIYLSMPISGYEINERIQHAADLKKQLSSEDNIVTTPFDIAPYVPNNPYGEYMKISIAEILKSDKVIFDKGWMDSYGCRVESYVAQSCGIKTENL